MTKLKSYLASAALVIACLSVGLAGVAGAQAVTGNVIVMLTRLSRVTNLYPLYNEALAVGTSTAVSPTGGASKFSVVLNYQDTSNGSRTGTPTYLNAFDVASSSAYGTGTSTADLFRVNSAGCVQLVATSSANGAATPIKLVLTATTSQGSGTNFVVDAAYGTCGG